MQDQEWAASKCKVDMSIVSADLHLIQFPPEIRTGAKDDLTKDMLQWLRSCHSGLAMTQGELTY